MTMEAQFSLVAAIFFLVSLSIIPPGKPASIKGARLLPSTGYQRMESYRQLSYPNPGSSNAQSTLLSFRNTQNQRAQKQPVKYRIGKPVLKNDAARLKAKAIRETVEGRVFKRMLVFPKLVKISNNHKRAAVVEPVAYIPRSKSTSVKSEYDRYLPLPKPQHPTEYKKGTPEYKFIQQKLRHVLNYILDPFNLKGRRTPLSEPVPEDQIQYIEPAVQHMMAEKGITVNLFPDNVENLQLLTTENTGTLMGDNLAQAEAPLVVPWDNLFVTGEAPLGTMDNTMVQAEAPLVDPWENVFVTGEAPSGTLDNTMVQVNAQLGNVENPSVPVEVLLVPVDVPLVPVDVPLIPMEDQLVQVANPLVQIEDPLVTKVDTLTSDKTLLIPVASTRNLELASTQMQETGVELGGRTDTLLAAIPSMDTSILSTTVESNNMAIDTAPSNVPREPITTQDRYYVVNERMTELEKQQLREQLLQLRSETEIETSTTTLPTIHVTRT